MSEEIEEVIETLTTCDESILGIERELRRNFYDLPKSYRKKNEDLFYEIIVNLKDARTNIEQITEQLSKKEVKKTRHKEELSKLFSEEEEIKERFEKYGTIYLSRITAEEKRQSE